MICSLYSTNLILNSIKLFLKNARYIQNLLYFPRYIQEKMQVNDWPFKQAVKDCSLYPRARYIDARYIKIPLLSGKTRF